MEHASRCESLVDKMSNEQAKPVLVSTTPRCAVGVAVSMLVVLSTVAAFGDEQRRGNGRSSEAPSDHRFSRSHTPAERARRKLHLLASLDDRFSQPEAAISGVMDEWLDVSNFRTAQQLLKPISAKRMLSWTVSGSDLQGFEAVWIVETGGRHMVVCANIDTLVVVSLTKDDAKKLEPLWKDFNKRIGKSHIEEPEKGTMILGGTVNSVTIQDDDGERFLFCYGCRQLTDEKWDHLYEHRKTVRKLAAERAKANIVDEK